MVFNKSNGSVAYGPADGNTLWQALGAPCSSSTNLDEVAQFDKLANRWVMMMPVFASPVYLCIAVSTTSDAINGSWNVYAFELPVNKLCDCRMMPDYPKLAVWPDGYYISYDQGWNLNYEGPNACVVDRNSMLSGDAATMQCFANTGGSYGVLLPADVDGTTPPPSGSPEYFLNFDSNDQSLDLWQFHVNWATPADSTFTGPTNIPVAAFTEPCGETIVELNYTTGACVPQSGTSQELDSYGDRLMYRLAYRNFGGYASLLANQTVNTGTGSQTGIRWYELPIQDPVSESTNKELTHPIPAIAGWAASRWTMLATSLWATAPPAAPCPPRSATPAACPLTLWARWKVKSMFCPREASHMARVRTRSGGAITAAWRLTQLTTAPSGIRPNMYRRPAVSGVLESHP